MTQSLDDLLRLARQQRDAKPPPVKKPSRRIDPVAHDNMLRQWRKEDATTFRTYQHELAGVNDLLVSVMTPLKTDKYKTLLAAAQVKVTEILALK